MGKLHKKGKKKTNQSILTGSLHYCTLLSKEFLLFSTIPISVEMVVPIQTTIAVCLTVFFAIHAFENMRMRLIFLGGHSICFLVIYAILHFFSVMFGDVSSIAFSTSGNMRITAECQMVPFPAVLAL